MTTRTRPSPASQTVLVALIVACALSRLVPHPPNFSPIEATALFAGAYLGSRWAAVAVPILAMMLSDWFLGWHDGLLVVYACVAAMALAGTHMAGRVTAWRVARYALISAVGFFVVTNAFVWLTSGMYPRTGVGLWACYVAAIPFFHNQLAGVALYATLLFGAWGLWQATTRRKPASAS